MNPQLKFAYWPRYVSRVIRIRADYRGDLLGWKIASDRLMPFEKPDEEEHCMREKKFLPVWRFSEQYPWNVANRLSENCFPSLEWCVKHPDHTKTQETLAGTPKNDQLLFKDDRVLVLIGDDSGKVGQISSVLPMRRLCFVKGLHVRVKRDTDHSGNTTFSLSERPLRMDTEVSLVDPEDGKPCEAEWRTDEKGERVRVSKKSGRIIPLPSAARILEDFTDPVTYVANEKDSTEKEVKKITNKMLDRQSPKLQTFEEELCEQYSLDMPDNSTCKTYWY